MEAAAPVQVGFGDAPPIIAAHRKIPVITMPMSGNQHLPLPIGTILSNQLPNHLTVEPRELR
jgi:hypothetical protein